MQTIKITQQNATEKGFEAKLTIGGAEFGPIEVSDPFAPTPQKEEDLEWYFERWIRFPFTDTTQAANAAASVKAYGVALFDQVFGDKRAFAAYQQLAGNLSDVEIVIEGDPTFQGLHWEALWDNSRAQPLAVDCGIVRQRRVSGGLPQVRRTEGTQLNLLVVTARPDEEKDVAYRTISRPLVEGIANAQVPVNVELLRPGTFEAFLKRLEERGEGYYHIVHFDMHGSLMTFAQFQGGREPGGSYTFQRGYGLSDLAPYAGEQGFLFFEGTAAGASVPVTAQELSDQLKKYGISVCILNACQSGKQGLEVQETSLGARLMDAGMQMVLAMAYSVTVDAARLLVTNLYQSLFAGQGVDKAVRLARRELYAQKQRQVYFGQRVDLEDWLLPVVYRNLAVDLRLRRMYPDEENAYFTQQAERFRFANPFQAEYGFVGRDLEILKLEKGLIRDGNILMLYGMGGTGKTTLLKYLWDWWVQTGFVAGVSYFGYDERGWKLEQIMSGERGIAQAIFSESELRSFQAKPVPAQIGKLVQELRGRDWLLVLDNLESVTGQALAIQNTLTEPEQAAIREFLVKLRDGKTRVLLGSRRREDWLKPAFGSNEYELRGLDAQARTELAEKVVAQHVSDGAKRQQILADKDFARLMKLLAGYPLAIQVVLGNLAQQSATEILAGLDAADVSLDREGNKTESILQCVEYSHGNLSAQAQRVLLCLAPFSGFIFRLGLENYVNQLQAAGSEVPLDKGDARRAGGSAFAELTLETLETAVAEAIHWGLLTPIDSANPHLLTIQPIFPYFLKTKLTEEDESFRDALQLGFKNHYEGLAGSYQSWLQSKEPQKRQMGIVFCRWEYENLYSALQIALERKDVSRIWQCIGLYLESWNNPSEELAFYQNLHSNLSAINLQEAAQDFFQEAIRLFGQRANVYVETKQYTLAKTAYQETLALIEKHPDKEFKSTIEAITYHQLGRVAQEQRQYEEARTYYQQALQIKIDFNDRYSQARTYHQLGIVAQEQRQYEEARTNYQQALQIFIDFNDRYEQAGTYHQLGRVAEELRQYEEARTYYQQALQIKIDFNDRYSQARTYHQLGRVAEELRQYEEARTYYQQALQIKIDFNDRYSQARTYHQLGIVAQEQRQYEEARTNYQQALQIFIEFNDRYSQASTYFQLGKVAEALEELEEAISYYMLDLQITLEFNDQNGLGISLRNLHRLYQTHPSPQLLTSLAQSLGCSEAEVLQRFAEMGEAVTGDEEA